MAGVLFIICVPCENYEQILVNKHWETTPVKSTRNVQQIAPSSSDEEINYDSNSKESRHSSLETFAVSIESDSLNRAYKKDDETDKRKRLGRTKSVDDVTAEKTSDNRLRSYQLGSMDSDKFKRLQQERTRVKENEEAIDKFFGPNRIDQPPIDETSSMEKVVREIVEQMHIKNSSWIRVNSGNSYQVTFTLENGVRCDDTIHMLSEFGIGQKPGSSVSIIPCTLYSDRQRVKDDDEDSSQSVIKETAWNKFIGTVRARMNVAKIVDAVKTDASLTFDFISLLIVASILACFGLVEDSTLFLAASMLISPLMGPILAATFGGVIKDHKLQYWGLSNEIIGIFMCIFVGFLFGLITCALHYGFSSQDALGLSSEMTTRTMPRSVLVGICIALPSGAAIAISVLGNNFGSLVGVAISASLLPPACNTGLLWSYSLVHVIFKNMDVRYEKIVNTTAYSENQAIELLTLGAISLCVTLSNVLCIYIMGFIFLKVKEVAPVSDEQRQFWKHDIKIARDYNKTVNADEGKKLQEELAQFHENASDNFRGVGAELLKQSNFPHTNTWSPLTLRNYKKDVYNTRTSLREFEALYTSLSGKNISGTEKHHRHITFNRSCSPTNIYTEPSHVKHSSAICISPKHSSDYIKVGSAPLEVITEIPRNSQPLLSGDGFAGTSSGNKKKFIVTRADESKDPMM